MADPARIPQRHYGFAMTGASLQAENVCVELGGRPVVEDITLTAGAGQVIGVVGPNGSGKSTLLRALLGILPLTAGSIRVDGTDIRDLSARHLARRVAAVLQDNVGDFDLRARDVVAMGRAPYKRIFQRDNAFDKEIIDRSLDLLDAGHLADRPIALMSGGERQRVLTARALTQQPGLLVLDEPTNHLDVRHQFAVLALPGALGITAVIALHDLNLAAHYCDRIHVLDQGHLVCSGTPEQVLTSEMIASVYGVTAQVSINPRTGRPAAQFTP